MEKGFSHYFSHQKLTARAMGIFLLAVFLAAPFSASAQALLDNAYTASDISVELAPAVPIPNQSVTITLSSFSVNLDKAQMTWTQDGKTKNVGTGIKSYSLIAGDVGSTTTVTVSIIINSSNRFDKKIVISPSEVDLLWEAVDSYVPAFYEGKALPSSEATIKVVALPNIKGEGANLKPGDYVYNWKRNYVTSQGNSGFAKNSFTFKTSYLNKEESVTANASSVNGTSGGEGRLNIITGKPKILFYEESPLEGTLFAKALNTGYRLTDKEANITAEPFFFSVNSPSSKDLGYRWSINNNAIDTPSPQNMLVIRNAGTEGRAKVGVKIESSSKLFQLLDQSFFVDIIK